MKKKIAFFVLILHMFLLSAALFSPVLKKVIPTKKHLVVNTISQQRVMPATKIVTAHPSVAKPPAPSPPQKKGAEKKPIPPKKNDAEKPPISSLAPKKEKKQFPSKKSEQTIPKELVQKFSENLAKIENHSTKKPVQSLDSLAIPEPVRPLSRTLPRLENQEAFSLESDSYENSLINLFYQHLHLPEHGEVRINLTLGQDGHVINLKVVSAQNERNKIYLEKNLPLLRFPSFKKNLADRQTYTFTLTFSNEFK